MKKIKAVVVTILSIVFVVSAGCAGNKENTAPSDKPGAAAAETKEPIVSPEVPKEVRTEALKEKELKVDENMEEAQSETEAEIREADWSDYFHGLNGTAVIYIPSDNRYTIYQEELSKIRRSPCSTFKIISSLIGLEEDVIKDADTVRKWSKEIFWNEKWNRDIGFKDAFQSSCIWFFREVINELGPEKIQEQLDSLNYGNNDISDWEGRLNNNNNNPALTGFWVESSLKISAKEQTEVMERIFGENSPYNPKTLELLKDAMLVTDADTTDIKIYGKTGMGKSHGVTVDVWYTGFSEKDDKKIYFCIYIGESDGMDVSSAEAKQIAIQLISDNKNDF